MKLFDPNIYIHITNKRKSFANSCNLISPAMTKGCCIVGCEFFGNRGRPGQTIFHVFPDPDRELYRHNQWRAACSSNPRMLTKDNQQVFRHYRICRRHFAPDSLNGGCRRLLGTAVPTLYLTVGNGSDEDPAQTHNASVTEQLTTLDVEVHPNKRTAAAVDVHEDDYMLLDATESLQADAQQHYDDGARGYDSSCKRRKLLDINECDDNLDDDSDVGHVATEDEEIEWIVIEEEPEGAEEYDYCDTEYAASKCILS